MNWVRSIEVAISSAISRFDGQMSRRYTGRPSDAVPSGAVVMSSRTVPRIEYATTSGGLAR